MRKGTIIVGKIASGKSFVSYQTRQENELMIEIGQIVRNYLGSNERVQNKMFDDLIIDEVAQLLDETTDDVVIVAPRNIKVMNNIVDYMDNHEIDWSVILVEADDKVRKERYENAFREKDKDITFEEADARDSALGIDDLINYIKNDYYGEYVCISND